MSTRSITFLVTFDHQSPALKALRSVGWTTAISGLAKGDISEWHSEGATLELCKAGQLITASLYLDMPLPGGTCYVDEEGPVKLIPDAVACNRLGEHQFDFDDLDVQAQELTIFVESVLMTVPLGSGRE